MYRSNTATLENILSEHELTNSAKVKAVYGHHVVGLQDELEAHYRIINETAFLLGPNAFTGNRKTESALLSCIHKGFFLYHAVLLLTCKGLYGPARTLLRSIFEALVIAKYCTVENSTILLEKWESGAYINLNNDVFNKIKNVTISEMRFFLKSLHELTHATTKAQQVTMEFEEIRKEILSNFSLMQLLLSCTYHLLSRHWLTPSTVYYTQMYANKASFSEARRIARETSKSNRKHFTAAGRRLLREYCATWHVTTEKK